MRREFIAETNVAEWPAAEMDAVDPDVAVSHHAVKINEHATTSPAFGNREVFPIPAYSGGSKTTCCSGRVLLIKWSFDSPIVRYIEFPPVVVVKGGPLGTRWVAQGKPPVRIKFDLPATLSPDRRRHKPHD